MIQLVQPSGELRAGYLAMLDEHLQAGETAYDRDLPRQDFEVYLQKLAREARGADLPPGVVPQTTFWLVRDHTTILGESRLRHALNPRLEQFGGHIGYVIRPSERRKGYATLLLALTLEQARALSIERVRITCDTDNLASVRVIEKNGGVLSGQCVYEGKPINQYWVAL